MKRCFSGRDDAHYIATSIAVINAEKSDLLAVALEYESILAVCVFGVETQDCIGIIENRARLVKADAMLAEVGLGFSGIPFKAHDRSPST